MAHKTRWQHLPTRYNEYDMQACVRRHQAQLRKDHKLVVFVVKNVRPTQPGDSDAPFILVGPRTFVMDRLKVEYKGRANVGRDELVSICCDMDVRQVCVMSPLDRVTRDTLCSEMGYDGFEAWQADLLTQAHDAYDMPIVWYGATVLDFQVPRLLTRMYEALDAQVQRAIALQDKAPQTRAYGECGRVPVSTNVSPIVTITR